MPITAWYMDESSEDQRKAHQLSPNVPVGKDKLNELGVLSWEGLNAADIENDETFKKIRSERGYTYNDRITCHPDTLPDYEKKIKSFFEEHIHTDEEIRLVLDGTGYFDVRDENDKWIRIGMGAGDMIVLPAGIYHRFTLDEKDYIKAMRLFVGEPVWTPYNRPCDSMDARKSYVQDVVAKLGGAAGAESKEEESPAAAGRGGEPDSADVEAGKRSADAPADDDGAGKKPRVEESKESESAAAGGG